MKLWIAILGLLLLIGAVSAQPINTQLGSYTVSLTMPMYVTTDTETKTGETNNGAAYVCNTLIITNPTSSTQIARISLWSYASPEGWLTEEQMSQMMESMGMPAPTTFSRTIDGTTATMARGFLGLTEIDAWSYGLDTTGTERMVGVSSFPWDDGTTAIIDTLHVTK